MARFYGSFPRGSSPVALFSGLGQPSMPSRVRLGVVADVAGNMGAEAGPLTRLGVVRRTEGNYAAEVGPITRLSAAGVVAGRMAAEAGPRVALGVAGTVAGRMAAEAGPRLALGQANTYGGPVRLGVAGMVAGRMAAEAGPRVQLGAAPVVGLGRATAVSLGQARARFGRMYGFGEDTTGGFTEDQLDCLSSQGDDVTPEQALARCGVGIEKPEKEWDSSDYARLISAIGGAVAPILNAAGQLVNPQTGQPLNPQQADLYRRYSAAKKKEESGLPKWAIPAGIAAVVVVGALLYMKKK